MKHQLQRRRLLKTGAAAALGLSGLQPSAARATRQASALRADPNGILDLCEGFSYRILSRGGDAMNDGYRTPGRPDAMGVFPGPAPGTLALMRNHEVPGVRAWGPYHDDQAIPPESYDPAAYGGVTRLVIDAKSLEVQRSNLVLCGTHWNCAGGMSPWGWLSCEEAFDPRHGYVFLCPHTAEQVQRPQRISAYGHFRHEAACVDPETCIAYLSEDREDSAFYRFVPNDKRRPFVGKLQALAIHGEPGYDTNAMKPGDALPVAWVDVRKPDSAHDDVRHQAQAAGAARFVRGEGLWLSGPDLYLCATAGGPTGRGQIFRLAYRDPANLSLLTQCDDPAVLDMPDNITVSPSGHVYVAEDGIEGNYVRHITATGGVVDVARCAGGPGEFAGACFSPDGRTMFVNLQAEALTFAIQGPFDRLTSRAARAGAVNAPEGNGYLGLGTGVVVLALAALVRRKAAATLETRSAPARVLSSTSK